jgi:putative Mg2+ transporter-C (MgtC) family protein
MLLGMLSGINNDDLSMVLRLLLSLALSAGLGWERERLHRAAGLRTHMLVGMSATLFVSLGLGYVAQYPPASALVRGPLSSDPLRLIEAVVAGVSFIGAGTIFVSRSRKVQGITTAASLLCTAAVGVAVAFERILVAVASTLMVLVVLAVLRRLEPDTTPAPQEQPATGGTAGQGSGSP